MSLFREFRPALFFLGKFLGVYLAGNIIYGLYIESYGERPDTVTQRVAIHTCALLNLLGENTSSSDRPDEPSVYVATPSRNVLSVFEGCNGLNVMIVFVAFVIAFGGSWKKMLWFMPAGILVIHLFNLARLSLLFYIAENFKENFYFFHKYVFTAIIYAAVFLLWAVWVLKLSPLKRRNNHADEKA